MKNDNIGTLIKLLPGRLIGKAKLLYQYIKDINLDKEGRVIYDDNALGSYLLDLIRFYVSPKNMSPARPIDAIQFGKILLQKSVPSAAIGSGRILDEEIKGSRLLLSDALSDPATARNLKHKKQKTKGKRAKVAIKKRWRKP